MATCPSGTYANPATNQCVPCNTGCLACTADSNNIPYCYECNTTTFLYGGSCQSICPSGMYGDTNFNWCAQCSCNCSTCSSYSVCTTCKGVATQDPNKNNECSVQYGQLSSPILNLSSDYTTATLWW